MDNRTLIQPDIEFIKYLKKNGGDSLKECYQCATCSVVCSLSPQEKAFPRKKIFFPIPISGYVMAVQIAVHIAQEAQSLQMF